MLKRIDVSDGRIQELAGAPNPRGGSWGPDDVIVVALDDSGPLYAIPAAGGESRAVTEFPADGAGHMYPHFLPDGKHFLFLQYDSSLAGIARWGLSIGSLDSPEIQRVDGIRSRAEYVNGHLLFGQGDTLFAQRFDPIERVLEGERVRLADGLGLSFGTAVSYAFSGRENAVIYAHGGSTGNTRLATLDRQGRRLEMPDISGEILGFVLSPDQNRVAIERRDSGANTVDIWLADLLDGIQTRFGDGDPWVGMPLWSPAGDRILFTDWTGSYTLKNVRTGDVQTVATGAGNGGWPMDWSSDGQHVVFQHTDFQTLNDIWVLRATHACASDLRS